MRVLIAEDDGELRSLLEVLMRREGHEVTSAADGEAAYVAARAEAFDVLVMDVRMPHRTGLEVLRLLRGAGCGAPIVIMTAFGDEDVHEAALAAGADLVIDKPFAFEDLREEVRRLRPSQKRSA